LVRKLRGIFKIQGNLKKKKNLAFACEKQGPRFCTLCRLDLYSVQTF
jgi:hypothetical protein